MTKNDETGKVNRCGAKTRAGGQCQKPPVKGKRRCRLHGGLSTGAPRGNRNAVKHGIYSNRIWPEEQAMIPAIDAMLGSLDNELVLTRIFLHRALMKERQTLEQADLMEVTSRSERSRHGRSQPVTETVWRRVDARLDLEIDRLIARIASMEVTRAAILRQRQSAGDLEKPVLTT